MDQIAIFDVLSVMKHQEQTEYSTLRGMYDKTPVDVECRQMMVNWCTQIADFCKFSSETVAVAIHNLDRYVEKRPNVLHDKRAFQLVVMTCLYTSIKMNEPEAIDPACVSNLSRGEYSVKEVEETERDILKTLRWRLNPPTATSFAEIYLQLLPVYSGDVVKLIQEQIHLALADAHFLGTTNSSIAIEAVCNALSLLQPSIRADPLEQILLQSRKEQRLCSEFQAKLMERALAICGTTSRPTMLRRQSSKTMSSSIPNVSPRSVTITE